MRGVYGRMGEQQPHAEQDDRELRHQLQRGVDLLGKRASVKGWYSGIARDSEDTLDFSQRNNVASMNEIYPLEKAQEAYDRMLSGKARFRVVLKMDG